MFLNNGNCKIEFERMSNLKSFNVFYFEFVSLSFTNQLVIFDPRDITINGVIM